ncbi:MAG: hypothetical protein JO121_00065 [Deltaproteobacteria bacterium]|jgi:hypothetical protein|nr:hypothetical protein [Deltaproteobacteria bacterium]
MSEKICKHKETLYEMVFKVLLSAGFCGATRDGSRQPAAAATTLTGGAEADPGA